MFSGLVLPVGGIKEKVLAAHRGGITNVVLPYRNSNDVEELPANVRSEVKFTFVRSMSEVLHLIFEHRGRHPNHLYGGGEGEGVDNADGINAPMAARPLEGGRDLAGPVLLSML